MSFVGKVGRSYTPNEPVDVGSKHDILISVAVQEADTLWCAAAQRLEAYGLDQEDIEACIGPRVDVSIADCLRTLLVPFDLAGCAVQDIAVTARPDLFDAPGVLGLRSLITELSQSVDASAKRLLWASERGGGA